MPLRDFGGKQAVQRTMHALPIRIEYQSPRYEYRCISYGDDFFFAVPIREGEGKIRPYTNLDPYAIRDAFFAVKDPTEALLFLSGAGKFSPFENVRWSEFQEWQQYLAWLRIEPDEAVKDPRGIKAWMTSDGITNEFFSKSHISDADRACNDPEVLSHMRATFRRLRRFAINPEGRNLSIEYRQPDDSAFTECLPVPRFQEKDLVPFLKISTHNTLEAISATVFADRHHSLRFGKCKHCGKLFQLESRHGQEFCPASGPSTSSACKNAAMQRVYRERDSKAIALLLACWAENLSESAIRERAAESGVRISQKALETAKKRWATRGV